MNTVDFEQKITELKTQLTEKDQHIEALEEFIKHLQQKKFSPSSEKIPPHQLNLFNEAEDQTLVDETDAVETTAVKEHTRTKKPRVSIPDHLPRENVEYDLSEQEKICPHDQTPLVRMGTEDHEQLDIIPAQIKVIRHRRHKYTCPCCKQYHVTASKPKQPIEKGMASPGLLAHVATQKYCDALPLYRQTAIFKRIGITLDRGNLANWMIRCGELAQPLINLLIEQIREKPVVHMDETTLQVLKEPGKTPQSKSYLWLMASFDEHPMIVFHYDPRRHAEVPHLLLDQTVKTLMIDGYDGYQPACNNYEITRLGCWAHARRKFVDAQKLQPKGKVGKSDQALAYIQRLYRIEKEIKRLSVEEKHKTRQAEAKPIIDKLRQWLEKHFPRSPPSMAIGKALYYLHNQWPRLIRYLEHGAYPMDNNMAENAVRPFAIGRKNWMFANSQAGAKASANLYSLIETAKANNLNPYDYLKAVFTRLPNCQTVEEIEMLLPGKVNL